MQPIILDEYGVARFKANALVRYLLDNGGIDMNELARQSHVQKWTQEDCMQFAQLIGYSVDGYGDLSYVTSESCAKADAIACKLIPERN